MKKNDTQLVYKVCEKNIPVKLFGQFRSKHRNTEAYILFCLHHLNE